MPKLSSPPARAPMTGKFRTPRGGRIDRANPIGFTFDGKAYQGLAGDTLATALLANGVHLMGRSFKYHRPRGPVSLGSDEPNALVTLDAGKGRVTPNLRATQIELYEGLTARSQNAWPSLERDAMAVNGRLSAFFPAGFYYKTFIQPAGAWEKVYEPAIRQAAGLGVAPKDPDPDRYAFEYRHCDVAVVGAGPAGLAAALSAARAGARVILFDEQAEFGGSLLVGNARDPRRQERVGMGGRGGRGTRGLAPGDPAAAHAGLRLLRAEFPWRPAAADRPSAQSRRKPAARAALAGARETGRPRDRRARAPAGLPR